MSKHKAKKPWLRLKGGETSVKSTGIAVRLALPSDEQVVVREVPAKVDGEVVGIAQIYEDGTVGVLVYDDCPQYLKDKIQAEADLLGYSIGMEDE